jgi:hypothetical protein
VSAFEKEEKTRRVGSSQNPFAVPIGGDQLARIGGFVGGGAADRTPQKILQEIAALRRDLVGKGIKIQEIA